MPPAAEPDAPLRAIARGDVEWAAFTVALAGAGLPADDLGADNQQFFALTATRAFGGYFVSGPDALLRSVIVPPSAQRRSLGTSLVTALMTRLETEGIERVWLLTVTAAPFFERLGFRQVERAAAPVGIAATAEFQGLCPNDAAFMFRPLK